MTARRLGRIPDQLAALADPRARWTLALLGVCALGFVPRLWVGVTDAIEYDGWWHIFAAQQDLWRNFVAECRALAHPPLYLILLRWSILFGKTRLVYRAVSIAAGTASIFLVASAARRVTSHPGSPLVAALAFALSGAAIELSCEVRSYSLAIVFVLAALDALLRLQDGDAPRPLRQLAAFTAASCLALLSHYYAAFFLGACAVVAAARPLVDPSLAARLRRLTPRQWVGRGAILAPVPLLAGVLYAWHAHTWVTALNHLPPFYLQAGGGETARAFLLRNAHAEFDLFSPIPLPAGAVVQLLVAAGLLLVFVALPCALVRKGGTLALGQATALAFVPILASALAAAGLLDAYPFGGWFRHQSLLVPFIVISLAVVLDRPLAPSRRRWVTTLAGTAVTAAILANFVHDVPGLAAFPGEGDLGRPFVLLQEFPAPAAVYADSYSFVALFSNLDRCSWRYVDGPREGMQSERYRVTCGDDRFFVLRNHRTWNADLTSEHTYRWLRADLTRARIPTAVVYFVEQFPPPGVRAPGDQQALEERIRSAGSRSGLAVGRIVRTGRYLLVRVTLPAPPGGEALRHGF